MRPFLLALLMANVVMLLVLQSFRPSGLEPERLALQQHAERITVQTPGKPLPPLPPVNSVSPVKPLPQRAPGKCIEAGDFTAQTAARFEAALPQLSLPLLPVKRVVQAFDSSIARLMPQLDTAMAAGDMDGVRSVAHTLKSSMAPGIGGNKTIFNMAKLFSRQNKKETALAVSFFEAISKFICYT